MRGIAAVAHRLQGDVLGEIRRAEIVIPLLLKHRVQQIVRHHRVARASARAQTAC